MSSSNTPARYTRSTEVVTREIAGETILVPICNRVADLESIFTLNETGSCVWRALERGASIEELTSALCAAFEVSEVAAGRDTVRLLEALSAAGLVRAERPA